MCHHSLWSQVLTVWLKQLLQILLPLNCHNANWPLITYTDLIHDSDIPLPSEQVHVALDILWCCILVHVSLSLHLVTYFIQKSPVYLAHRCSSLSLCKFFSKLNLPLHNDNWINTWLLKIRNSMKEIYVKQIIQVFDVNCPVISDIGTF